MLRSARFTGGMVALPAVLSVAGALGMGSGVAAELATPSNNSPLGLAVGAGVALTVAVLGLIGTIWNNRRRNNSDDPTLTPEARLSVVETNQADMKSDIDEMKADIREILEHVRPWPAGERHKR